MFQQSLHTRYSAFPSESMQLALFLASEQMQALRFQLNSNIPSLVHLSSDSSLCYPNGSLPQASRFTVCDIEEFPRIEPRPSTITAPRYAEVSSLMYTTVNAVLIGEVTAEEAVRAISCGVHIFMGSQKSNIPETYPIDCPCIYLALHRIAEKDYPTACIPVSNIPSTLIVVVGCLLATVAGLALIAWCKESAKYRNITKHMQRPKSMKDMRLQPSVELVSYIRKDLAIAVELYHDLRLANELHNILNSFRLFSLFSSFFF